MQKKHMAVPFEMKGVDEEGVFEGYGSVFGVEDSYGDIVAKGAFKLSLSAHRKAGTMPSMLWQHDPSRPIGVYTDMKEDDHGLFLRGKIVLDSSDGKDAYALLKAGALTGLSIGFMTKKYERDNDTDIRTLTELDLWEVSPVTFPANSRARVSGVKAADMDADTFALFIEGLMIRLAPVVAVKGWKESIRDFEKSLRDEGAFSNPAAKAIASGGFKTDPHLRDEGGEALSALLKTLKDERSRAFRT